ncbi:MAG: hypothetical protein ABL999_15755 [Pyrinomonadaceae bacterium]
MRKSSIAVFLLIFLALGVGSLVAQHGGKAEPKRIQFASGKSSAALSGSLSNGQEMEYVFEARKGQHVTIRNATKSLFDFRVFSDENFPDGDFDSSPSYTFEIPETGDYMFFVRKKQVKTPRTARFSMTLTIK